ncbi:MAG TPA: alpha/beta hydrolase [Actinophytocola sp.]|uniref:alpha/beta hydrolase n=1 Tax=Actinophytocola sp. TaxID=1872138 RepID=UPI002DDCBDEF|nr:alpha/beta hydrolase [Actinophytocola sp.]HEV2781738.1 alpha/beta hydrolase [Actinophytocola sp.]
MSRLLLARRVAQLGLTANALRPARGVWSSIPAFFAGWLTAELAPQLLVAQSAGAIAQLARGRVRTRDERLALAMSGLSIAGLGALIASGRSARKEVEHALRETLGEDYASGLERLPEPADLATPWRDLIVPFRMRNPEVVRLRNLPYAPGGRRFHLDVYHHERRPTGRPVLLHVHGGAWVVGSKDEQGIPLMLHMAAKGWVCVSVNYPLAPRSRWPEHIIAVKRALAWIRAHGEEYGADPSFVAVTGGSAGGHLAALLALSPNDPAFQPGFEDADTEVQACVPHYGAYDFAGETGTRATKQRLRWVARYVVGQDPKRHPEIYRAASPLSRVNADAPPFFVIHGHGDSLIPVAEARAFVDALRAVSGNPVVYAELAGAQHAFDIFPSIRSAHVVRGVERFLDWTYRRSVAGQAEQPLTDHVEQDLAGATGDAQAAGEQEFVQ